MPRLCTSLLLYFLLLHPNFAQETKFIFNGFHGSNLTLSGIASVMSGMIQLTNTSSRCLGRALYPIPVQMKNASTSATFSFSTTFVFSIVPLYPGFGGHGMAFMMAPRDPTGGFSGGFLGMLAPTNNANASNHLFAVEFDTVQDLEFFDVNDNHVGVDLNSMVSVNSSPAAYRIGNSSQQKVGVDLKGGEAIQAWIQYQGLEKQLNVSISIAGKPQPPFPLLSVHVDLSTVLQDYMYVGFSASTGVLSETHNILAWSFNNNGASQILDLSRLPSNIRKSSRFRSRGFIVGVCTASVVLLLITIFAAIQLYKRRRRGLNEDLEEDWESGYGPHKFSYKELSIATKGFHEKEMLGAGGFGHVYKGVLPSTGREVAVKRLSNQSDQGLSEFIAELSSIGRLRHRNLVQLQGWSRRKGEFLLVYDYMPNGSLDKMLFGKSSTFVLGWKERYIVLSGVAAALVYLHEEWEQQVLHRDVKASNVLLDAELNAKLGDFGLARQFEHGKDSQTTLVVGTPGYMAPEFLRTGKATASSDVYSFGALMLEVACGRRPLEPSKSEEELILVDWVWGLHIKGMLLHAADPKLSGCFVVEEMERVLQLGLLCSYPKPAARPTMRQVVQMLAGDVTLPAVPLVLPMFDSSHLVNSGLLSYASSSLGSWSNYDANSRLSGHSLPNAGSPPISLARKKELDPSI